MNILYTILIVVFGVILSEFLRYAFGFHSFFKKQKVSWIGFDLDGTLALSSSDGKFHRTFIGEPIPATVDLLKKYLDEGRDVKILTARVSTNGTMVSIYDALTSRYLIRSWSKKHLGKKLDVVCVKDFRMHLLYDDRVVQVKTDTGEILH